MNNHRLLTAILWILLCCIKLSLSAQEERIYTLAELFEIAERQSVMLKPYITAETVAERDINVAKASRLPDISANLSLSYIGNGFTTNRTLADYQKAPIPHLGNMLSMSVEQPIYTGGAISTGIELADLKYSASQKATDIRKDNIRFNIVDGYLAIYRQYNLRKVVKENLALAKKELEEMRARYSQGIVLLNDITRYELLVSNLELQLLKTDNILKILQRNMVGAIGLPENTCVLPDTTIIHQLLPVEKEEWWQQQAEIESPILKLANSEIEINKKIEKLDRSSRLPQIGLKAFWTLDGPILVEVPPINRNLCYWYVGLGVSYNLSSLYKNNKTEARNKMKTLQARQNYDATREQLEMDIKADHIRYLESYEELKTQQKSVELADKNYNTISLRYFSDMALITDMIDAANSKLEAETLLVNAKINILFYYYKLQYLTGTI